MDDAALVEQARLGDTTAFGELVERHRGAVYRAARAALGSPGEADDVVQDAFIAAYRKLGSFRGEASFKTWVLSIAWRKALDRRRSLAARLRRLVSRPQANSEPAADGPSAEGRLMASEQVQRIRELVARLPRRLRDPLLLAASGEHTLSEVAAVLGVPLGTVKWRVGEARKRLRERLVHMGYGRD